MIEFSAEGRNGYNRLLRLASGASAEKTKNGMLALLADIRQAKGDFQWGIDEYTLGLVGNSFLHFYDCEGNYIKIAFNANYTPISIEYTPGIEWFLGDALSKGILGGME